MNFILKEITSWLFKQIIGLFGLFTQLINASVSDIMATKLIIAFFGSMQLVLNFMLVVGIVFWFFKWLEVQEGGSTMDVSNHMSNLFIGFIYSQVLIPGIKYIYQLGIDISIKLGGFSFDEKIFDESKVSSIFNVLNINALSITIFIIIIVVIILIELFKYFKSVIKRFPMILLHIPLGAFYLPSIMNGNRDNLFTFFKSLAGVMISHIFSLLFVIFGLYFMSNMSLGEFVIGLGFIFAVPSIDEIFGAFAISTKSSGYSSGAGRLGQSALMLGGRFR